MRFTQVVKATLKNTLLISIFFIVFNMPVLAVNDEDNPLEILFIGSSLFNYNDLPNILRNIALTAEKNVFIEMRGLNGMSLNDHAGSALTAAKIRERNWDYIILQGSGGRIAYPEFFNEYYEPSAILRLINKIADNCNSTRIIFTLPWAYENGMLWAEGYTDTYVDMQEIIYSKTFLYQKSLGFTIAPVGNAWHTVLDEQNYPLHYLHQEDWIHPSERGSYLAACVVYSSIFLETTENIPSYDKITESDAKYYQSIASDIVLNDTVLWKISTYNDTTLAGITNPIILGANDGENISSPGETNLEQNFPNPFSSTTQIKYHLQNESFVVIEVFDLSGKKHSSFTQNQQAGEYIYEFNGENLKNGIYFYSLRTNNSYQIKKMLFLNK